MKFSIVIPVLDGAAFLDQALRSICAQTHDNWECIIVDGGSTDRSRSIARTFCEHEARISLVEQKSEGLYDAIIQGMVHSDGQMLSWLGADDLYAPWALASVQNYCLRNQADWVTGIPCVWDSNGNMRMTGLALPKPRWMIRQGFFRNDWLGDIQAECTFFSRVIWASLEEEHLSQIRHHKLAGDYFLWRTLAAHNRLRTMPVMLGGFRLHGNNRSLKMAGLYAEEANKNAPVRLPGAFGLFMQFFDSVISSPYIFFRNYNEIKILNIDIQKNKQ